MTFAGPAPDAIVMVDIADVTKDFTVHIAKSLKDRVTTLFKRRDLLRQRFRALDHINLQIRRGETVGLVGHNGSGKSTLLKIIGGILDSSEGSVSYRGRLAALLELGAGFHPDLTGRENIYLNASVLGLTREHTDSVFDDIVAFSGLEKHFLDSQVKFYSSGMYVRLAFAVAVHSDPDILLVDEVLAVGDERFQVKCLAKIRDFQEQGKTIVLVSHSAEQVADVCSRVVVLDHGSVVFDGGVDEGLRALRDSYETARVAESQVAVPGRRKKAPDVEILGVDVLDAKAKNEVGIVKPGDDVVVRLKVRVNKSTKWVAGFTFDNSKGQFVYLLNSLGLKLDLPTKRGEYAIDFRLPKVNFGATRIVVSAGTTLLNGTPLDNVVGAAEFDIEPDPHGAGFLQFDVSAGVRPLESSAG